MKIFLWTMRYIKIITLRMVYSYINRIRFYLRGACIGQHLDVYGWIHLIIHPESEIKLGDFVRLNSGFDRNAVGGDHCLCIQVGRNAKLIIGHGVGISNSTIICMEKIVIDEGVLIGGGCDIYDTDFHGIDPSERRVYTTSSIKTAPIHIKKNSFIGSHTLVLKGVTIGEGAIVGAGSVVTKDLPDFEIWAGNPVHKIGSVNPNI
jgi:acetyltransferase-like isoleucine patch superfamily enzyme